MSKALKDTNISSVIKRRKYNLAVKEGYISLLMRIIILAIAGYIIFTQVFLIMQNHGLGMFPAVKDGDLVLAYRLQKDYIKDDVVVYRNGDVLCVGRIVARENDVVAIDDSGTLTVSGTPQSGEIMYPTYAKEGIEYPYRITEKCVFIL